MWEQQCKLRLLHLALLATAVDGCATATCQSAYSGLMIQKGGHIYQSPLTHLGNFLNQITLMLLKKGNHTAVPVLTGTHEPWARALCCRASKVSL